jgi:hypothetical protein
MNPSEPNNEPAPYTPTQVQPIPQQTQPNPGKGLGIAGFVLAFFPVIQLAGLGLSIAGLVKSKRAGYKNGLALAGIILSSLFFLGSILFVFLFAISIVSYNGITARANTSAAQSSAASVIKYSEIYYSNNGTYPTASSQLETSSSITFSPEPLTSTPTYPSTVDFYNCNDGNKVGFWDYTQEVAIYMYSGEANEASVCQLAN